MNMIPPFIYRLPGIHGMGALSSDASWASVTLQVGNDNAANGSTTIIDQSGVGAAVTLTGNTVWTNTTAPTGLSTSIALDGTGDYFDAPTGADYRFAGDFTVEGWIRRTVTGANNIFYDCRASAASATGFTFYIGNDNKFYVFSNNANRITSAGTISVNTWTHYAFSRSGTSAKLFAAGAQVGSTWTTSANFSDGNCRIGSDWSGALGWQGQVAAIRVTPGVARYTGAFTPPTLPLPTVST